MVQKCLSQTAGLRIFTLFLPSPIPRKEKGISAFIVEKDFEGFLTGKKEKKLGIRSSPTTEITFEDCVVPAKKPTRRRREGFKIAMKTLDGGRNGIAAQAVGIAQGRLMRHCNTQREKAIRKIDRRAAGHRF